MKLQLRKFMCRDCKMKFGEGPGIPKTKEDKMKCSNCGSTNIEDRGLQDKTVYERSFPTKKYDPKSP